MRIVIVTGKAPHHRALCAQMARTQNIVGIFHPAEPSGGLQLKIRRVFRQLKREGLPATLFHLAKVLPAGPRPSGLDPAQLLKSQIGRIAADYKKIPAQIIFENREVKSPATWSALRALKADVMVCLGGPVYPAEFIESVPLVLNFHSGISPIYNGASSTLFAFANGHPHLCGGTLMTMNTIVDGGGILGHFLPAIDADDSAESMFLKTVAGAPAMFQRFLTEFVGPKNQVPAIPQPRPLFYTRGIDLGWQHQVAARGNWRKKIGSRHLRAEKSVEYWRATSPLAACEQFSATIQSLLWDKLAV